MFAHIAKLIWNRKRANMLILTEVAITFVVLFFLIHSAINNYQLYNKPLGFQWQKTWSIALDTGARWNNENDNPQLQQLVKILEQDERIASIGLSQMPAFQRARWSDDLTINGKEIFHYGNRVNTDGPQGWGVELIAGRWFGEQDNGQNYHPIMINKLFVEQAFGDADPINFDIISLDDDGKPEGLPKRIVGVFEDFRQMGEFSESLPYMFNYFDLEQGHRYGVRYMQITFHENQNAAYEETLLKTLKSVTPQWEFNISTWANNRDNQINTVLIPLSILATVVGFLLIMVAMGLFGVLWQNINRRTQEIGLRRALGASKNEIQGQVIGELVILALFSIIFTLAFLVQLPLLSLLDSMTWSSFWLSIASTTVVILFIVVLCALYPSRAAIKMPPAEALHYE